MGKKDEYLSRTDTRIGMAFRGQWRSASEVAEDVSCSEGSVTRAKHNIRKLLGRHRILTKRGVGYRLLMRDEVETGRRGR